jgi:hypothetical protein
LRHVSIEVQTTKKFTNPLREVAETTELGTILAGVYVPSINFVKARVANKRDGQHATEQSSN